MPKSLSSTRIATLDVIRGVAVMGILMANIPAFGLPEPAYYSPAVMGPPSGADLAAWGTTFVLVEGKMRGLFTFLFGASMLLVMDRAEAVGDSAADVHFRRMIVLFGFGVTHLYLFWWGDILSHYALVGAAAFLFRKLPARALVMLGLMFVALEWIELLLLWLNLFPLRETALAPGATAHAIAAWRPYADAFGNPLPGDVQAEIDAMHGGFWSLIGWRARHAADPLNGVIQIGLESLGYMLLGMAAFRSGFLTGSWPRTRYLRYAALAFLVTLPVYIATAYCTVAHTFDARWVFFGSFVVATPFRPLMVVGYAALIVLLARPGGWLTTRFAAAGRMAFSNYLGTTLICTTLFYGYGFGLFAALPRAQLYLVVLAIWLLMLAWSKPWLDHFRYGPLEWLWRSLSRLEWQPMRGPADRGA